MSYRGVKPLQGLQDDFYELVSLANNGDGAALSDLVTMMIPTVRAQAAKYSGVSGVDFDDLFQEGMIAILSAVNTYKANCGAAFKTYAAVCTKNRIITAAKKSSLGKSVHSENLVPIEDDSSLTTDDLSPEDSIIVKENVNKLLKFIETNLTEKERSVLKLFLSGQSYESIAKELNSSPKSVDNALQRVRQKLKKYH